MGRNTIGPPPGSPEPRRELLDEDALVEFRRSTEHDIAAYQADRRARDAAEWDWDHRLPEDQP